MEVEKLDEFHTKEDYYRLSWFPGDNTYVITKLPQSNINVTRGQELYHGSDKEKAVEFFSDLKTTLSK